MKTPNFFLILLLILGSCVNSESDYEEFENENWQKRKVENLNSDSLIHGKSYLSIYSQIYSLNQHRLHNLTVAVSLRNISESDTIYILNSNYNNKHGEKVRTYFDFPIYLAPLETVEIIIEESDISGGTGSNFLFDWKIPKNCPEPFFEGVMSSTMGQQGLSFTTQGIRIK